MNVFVWPWDGKWTSSQAYGSAEPLVTTKRFLCKDLQTWDKWPELHYQTTAPNIHKLQISPVVSPWTSVHLIQTSSNTTTPFYTRHQYTSRAHLRDPNFLLPKTLKDLQDTTGRDITLSVFAKMWLVSWNSISKLNTGEVLLTKSICRHSSPFTTYLAQLAVEVMVHKEQNCYKK